VSAAGSEIITATIALQRTGAGEIQEVKPERLDSTAVVAPKAVLNEGEWLEFRLLVEGDKTPVLLRGHAAGFTLTTYTPRRRFSASEPTTALLLALIGITVVLSSMVFFILGNPFSTPLTTSFRFRASSASQFNRL
jgi:hypothetical protein